MLLDHSEGFIIYFCFVSSQDIQKVPPSVIESCVRPTTLDFEVIGHAQFLIFVLLYCKTQINDILTFFYKICIMIYKNINRIKTFSEV